MRFCSSCGARLSPENKFCPSCGTPVPTSTNAAAPGTSAAQNASSGTTSHDRFEQPTQAVPSSDSMHDQPTQVVPPTSAPATASSSPARSSSDDQKTRAAPSGSSAYSSTAPSPGAPHASTSNASNSSPSTSYPSSDDEATRAVDTSPAAGYASNGYTSASQGSPYGTASSGSAAASQHDGGPYASGYPSSSQNAQGYGSAGPSNDYSSAPYQRDDVAPAPRPSSVNLSDGGRSGGSNIGRLAAAAVAVIVLGGGAAFAYNSMKGDDDKKTSSSAPAQSSGASNASGSGAAAPAGTADSKPKTMPDLKGKSIDEAQALLSPAVKIEQTTNLKEGMNGGAVISAQETAPGQPTPDTVKVTVDQPANVTYIDEDNSLVVDSNPFSSGNGQIANHSYKHYDTLSMSGYDKDTPRELKLNLNRAYSRLRTDIAIDSDANDQDKVFTVTIKKDDSQVWSQQIKFGEDPKQIDLDVTDALRVQIDVSISGGTDDNQYKDSQLDFGDLRVLAEPGKGNSSPSSSS